MMKLRRSLPYPYRRRGSLPALAALFYVASCVHVAVTHEATLDACERTCRQWEMASDVPAATACHARATRIDFHDRPAGTFSLAVQPVVEVSPRSIIYTLGEFSARQSFDTQILDEDAVVAGDEIPRDGDVALPADGGDTLVLPRQEADSSLPPLATFLTAGYSSRSALQFDASSSKRTRIRVDDTVRSSSEVVQSQIYADGCSSFWQRLGGYVVTSDGDEPTLLSILCQAHGTWTALKRPMQLELNLAEQRNREALPPCDDRVACPAPISPEVVDLNSMPAVLTLKAGVSWLLSGLTASEEVSESTMKPLQRALKHHEGKAAEIRSRLTDSGDLFLLIVAGEGDALFRPRFATLLQSSVIKLASHSQPGREHDGLRLGRCEAVSEGPKHLDVRVQQGEIGCQI